MARLDRLGPAKEIAQLGATLGREFSYELLHAVSPLDEETLQQGLQQLVEAELLYQRGLPPQATLSLQACPDSGHGLSIVAQEHDASSITSRLPRCWRNSFPDSQETQPELLAHHYTEAGLIAQAIPYWQQAGQRAVQRSANVEAISHLTKGLELLKTLPDTPEHAQQELDAANHSGRAPLMATKGYAAPEVEKPTPARGSCASRWGRPLSSSRCCVGLLCFYDRAGGVPDGTRAGGAAPHPGPERTRPRPPHGSPPGAGDSACTFWESFVGAREHLEQGIALYDPNQHRSDAFSMALTPGVVCLSFGSLVPVAVLAIRTRP